MNTEEIKHRLLVLYNVLIYCSEQQQEGKPPCFSINERILINQERGSLYSQLSYEKQLIFLYEVRTSQCSLPLENKIQFALKKIEATSWGGFYESRFLTTDNNEEY